MSVTVTKHVWAMPCEEHSDKLVLLCLAEHVNEAQATKLGVLTCWPSVPTIARMCGLSEKTVYTSLSRLERTGVIKKLRKGGGPPGRSNMYSLEIPLKQLHPTPEATSQRPVAASGEPEWNRNGTGILTKDSPHPSDEGCTVKILPKWKPMTKEEKLDRLPMPDDFPSEKEYDYFLCLEGLWGLLDGLADGYARLCDNKWHHWNEKIRNWEPILDWKAYVRAFNEKIEEARHRR